MGSSIEFNSTLKLTRAQGCPEHPRVGERYSFRREGERLYHTAPTHVTLVEDVAGKWKYLGRGVVWEQTIHADTHETTGVFEVVQLYDEAYARLASNNESPAGKSFY